MDINLILAQQNTTARIIAVGEWHDHDHDESAWAAPVTEVEFSPGIATNVERHNLFTETGHTNYILCKRNPNASSGFSLTLRFST